MIILILCCSVSACDVDFYWIQFEDTKHISLYPSCLVWSSGSKNPQKGHLGPNHQINFNDRQYFWLYRTLLLGSELHNYCTYHFRYGKTLLRLILRSP